MRGGQGLVDMIGARRRDGWTVVARAASASYGARWVLRHRDGRERVVGGLHLRRAGWVAPGATQARKRGAPIKYAPGYVIQARAGDVVVVSRSGRGGVLRMACGHESRSPNVGNFAAQARDGHAAGRCWACYNAARRRPPGPCRCGRPRAPRAVECWACAQAACRNGRHACCGAPRRKRETQHACRRLAPAGTVVPPCDACSGPGPTYRLPGKRPRSCAACVIRRWREADLTEGQAAAALGLGRVAARTLADEQPEPEPAGDGLCYAGIP